MFYEMYIYKRQRGLDKELSTKNLEVMFKIKLIEIVSNVSA